MNYTINKLAQLAGVSVRTLHFYDEIGLLKPAYVADNGYRYYLHEQLFLLQGILFYKELGFELRKIKEILENQDFNQIEALLSHKKMLQGEIVRKQELIKTISKTIDHIERKSTMTDQEIFWGFSKEAQAGYEEQLIAKLGNQTEEHITQSYKAMKNWTKEDWQKSNNEFDDICKELTIMLKNKKATNSLEVQRIIKQHYTWLKKFWLPNKESYTGLGQCYVEPEFKKTFDVYDAQLASYMADAMKIFADQELK